MYWISPLLHSQRSRSRNLQSLRACGRITQKPLVFFRQSIFLFDRPIFFFDRPIFPSMTQLFFYDRPISFFNRPIFSTARYRRRRERENARHAKLSHFVAPLYVAPSPTPSNATSPAGE